MKQKHFGTSTFFHVCFASALPRKGDRVEAAAAGAPTPETVEAKNNTNGNEARQSGENLDLATCARQS